MINLWDSVVLITSSSPDNNDFGTGFAVHCDGQATFIITCSHVVDDIGGVDKIRVDGKLVTLVAPVLDDIDLTVLRVEGLSGRLPLYLRRTSVKEGTAFSMAGFQRSGKVLKYMTLRGVFARETRIGRTQSQFIQAWDLKITDDDQLQPGYSGSPVVDESGYTVGIVITRQGDGRKGTAISIEALEKVWPDMPSDLFEHSYMMHPQPPSLSNIDKNPILPRQIEREEEGIDVSMSSPLPAESARGPEATSLKTDINLEINSKEELQQNAQVRQAEEAQIHQARVELAQKIEEEELALKVKEKLRIFVCHSSQDMDFAVRLALDLRAFVGSKLDNEDAVWYRAPHKVHNKANTREVAKSNICIVVLSHNTFSEPWGSWVYDEIRTAEKMDSLIIPVACSNIMVPSNLKGWQRISFAPPMTYKLAFTSLITMLISAALKMK